MQGTKKSEFQKPGKRKAKANCAPCSQFVFHFYAPGFLLGGNMAKAPQFPMFVRNWLCSRTVSTMSGDAVKAFVYLLCEAWLQIPRATLPADDNELASMARLKPEQWLLIKSDVLRAFKVGQCEEHFERFFSELQLECSRNYEKNQRFNNKNALKTRKKRDANARVLANASDNAIDFSSLNPSGLKEGNARGGSKNADFETVFKNDQEKNLVDEFLKYRKELKKPFKTKNGLKAFVKRLQTLGNGSIETMKKIIEQSIANEWQGIFPLKQELPQKQSELSGRISFNDLAKNKKEINRA